MAFICELSIQGQDALEECKPDVKYCDAILNKSVKNNSELNNSVNNSCSGENSFFGLFGYAIDGVTDSFRSVYSCFNKILN